MDAVLTLKRFIDEQELLEDSYRLARQIYQSGFRPDFIVGVWRGGSTVGIYVQECLQYLGVESDHIAVRTSYSGRDDYLQQLQEGREMRAHGLQYLFENLKSEWKEEISTSRWHERYFSWNSSSRSSRHIASQS